VRFETARSLTGGIFIFNRGIIFFALILTAAFFTAGFGRVDKEALGAGRTETRGAEPLPPADGPPQPAPDSGNDTDKIIIECSVSLLPFCRSAGEAYSAGSDVTAVGRDAAVAAVKEGRCDFAVFSGDYKETGLYGLEPSDAFKTFIPGDEGIKVIVHPESPLNDITEYDIYVLFSDEDDFYDEFDNFEDFGFDEEWIFEDDGEETDEGSIDYLKTVIALAAPGTPSRSVFEDLFDLRGSIDGRAQSLVPEWANEFASDAEVESFVAENPDAVGIVAVGYSTASAKELTIGGNLPGSPVYAGKRQIIFLYREDRSKADETAAFLRSPEMAAICDDHGILMNDR
jgi:hypothetical protein